MTMENGNIELEFAGAVTRANDYARLANAAGIEYRACDEVFAALCDLFDACRELGMADDKIMGIARRYVEWSLDGEAWPRPDYARRH